LVLRPEIDEHLCFVLLRLEQPFLDYYEKIIKPAAKRAGLDSLQSSEIYGTRAIIRDIWDHIWRSKVVVAEVTGKNANVNYELGICHTLNVPTILLSQNIDDVPFDYRHRRCILYSTQEVGWDAALADDIYKTIGSVLGEHGEESELPWPYDTSQLSETGARGSLIVRENALSAVVRGASMVRDLVAGAYGPEGASVDIPVSPGGSVSLRSGSQIAGMVRSSNPLERRGVEAMARVASEIATSVGDGTKTGVILSHAMLRFGAEAIEGGHSPKAVTRAMEKVIESANGFILERTRSVKRDDVKNVARTAAGGDDYVATLVTEAIKRTGKDGVIAIEQSLGSKSRMSTSEGMRLRSGYLSEHFINVPERQECVLENCFVLLHERRISTMKSLLPILEEIARKGAPLLLIAEDVEGEALSTLVVNKLRETISCCAVKTPGHGETRRAILEDVATVTGARALTDILGLSLENVHLSDLGTAKKIVVSSDDTSIIGGGGSSTSIDGKASALRRQIQESPNDYERARLQQRLANLTGAIALLHAGGATQHEVETEVYKLSTALHSARLAIEGGCVLGGGQSLYRAASSRRLAPEDAAPKAGAESALQALQQPVRVLIENSKRSVTQVVASLDSSQGDKLGFDAQSGELVDLEERGVLEPTEGLRKTLNIAFSYARKILETGAWELGESEP
jgi:chaperonin GroEL